MKKLTIIIPHLSFGGAEKVTYNLVKELICFNNVDIDLILLKSCDLAVQEDTSNKIRRLGRKVNVIYSPYTRISFSFFFLLRYLYKNRERKILTVLNSVNSIVLFCNLLLLKMVDVTITVHDNFYNELKINPSIKNHIINYCIKNIYCLANRIIAVSDGIKMNLINMYNIPSEKVFRVYNPVLEEIAIEEHCVQHPWMISKKYKIILAVGSLRTQKNFQLLIQAFKDVHRTVNNARLIILGEGPLRDELQNLINSLNLTDCVDLYGYSEKVLQFMSASDLFVLSSKTEALPTVLIEALALHLNIVATDCHFGPREILKDGEYGYLVPVDDCCALTHGILKGLRISLHYNADMSQYYLAYATNEYLGVIFENEKN